MSLNARLDDWIIQGIKKENDIINHSLSQIRSCVKQSKTVYLNQLVLRIQSDWRLLAFESQDSYYKLNCYESIQKKYTSKKY